MLSLVAGVAWALYAQVTHAISPEEKNAPLIEPATLGRAFLPPLLWQAVVLTVHLDVLAGAFSYYLFVSLPLALLLFDGFATHAVYWLTASPASDHASKSFGRHIWAWRLFGPPPEHDEQTPETWLDVDPAFSAVIDAARSYRWGALWSVGATLAPPLLLVSTIGASKPTTLGLQLVLASFFGLLAAVILRSSADLRIVPCFFRTLYSWFHYGWEEPLPPWIFQSPCGGWAIRQLCLLATLGLLAVPLTQMASHSLVRIQEATQAHDSLQHEVVPLDGNDNVDRSRPREVETASSWLWLAPAVLVAMVVPPVNLCLLGLLLTGKLISAYEDAFERPIDEPPPEFPDEPDEEEAHAPHAGTGETQ